MAETIVNFFRDLIGNDYITVFIVSMIPFVEVRGSIPLAIAMGMNAFAAMGLAFLGSAILQIATDHKVYKRHVLHTMHDCSDFIWTAQKIADFDTPPKDWVETKYQRKALREGRKPVFFEYKRV